MKAKAENGTEYTYSGVCVFKNVGNNEYVNLSDYKAVGNDTWYFSEANNCNYLLGYYENDSIIVSGIELGEIFALANVIPSSNEVQNIIKYVDDNELTDVLIATLCAKHIEKHNTGKTSSNNLCKGKINIEFLRFSQANRQKNYVSILTKQFKKAG